MKPQFKVTETSLALKSGSTLQISLDFNKNYLHKSDFKPYKFVKRETNQVIKDLEPRDFIVTPAHIFLLYRDNLTVISSIN